MPPGFIASIRAIAYPFLKRNLWVWATLFVAGAAVIFVGPAVVGVFAYNLFAVLFSVSLVLSGAYYLMERSMKGPWCILMIVGVAGFVLLTSLFADLFNAYTIRTTGLLHLEPSKRMLFVSVAFLDFCTFVLIALVELLRYLRQLNFKIHQLSAFGERFPAEGAEKIHAESAESF